MKKMRRVRQLVSLLLLAACMPLSSACKYITFDLNKTGALVINEVVTSNKRSLIDEAVGSPDWIELYNGTEDALSLEGYGLSDNVRNLHKFTFPAVTLQPGEYLIVYACDISDGVESAVSRTGFGLSKSGEVLFLTDVYYNLIQQLDVPALVSDVSYARKPSGEYAYAAVPTPGKENTTDTVSSLSDLFSGRDYESLAISEVMPNDPDGAAWVELVNTGESAIRLEDYYLSDTETEPMRWQLPECTLEAGGRVVIYLDGADLEGEEFHASFKLGKEDDRLLVTGATGTVLSEAIWDKSLPAGLSAVMKDGVLMYTAFPTKGQVNSEELFAAATTTPMDAGDAIRINEVLRKNKLSIVDGDGDRSEWVELKNSSAQPASLHGLFLSDNPDNLFKWALPDITLEAGGYLVVFLSGKDRAGSELHASFGLGDDEEALYLTNMNGLRLDMLEVPLAAGQNVSVGRDETGANRYYPQPTPGYQNGYGFETADSIGFFNHTGIFISEVSAVQPAKSGQLDWIELCNGGSTQANLTGWYLSDDPEDPCKFQLGQVIIEPGQYIVIEASSKKSEQRALVAPFGLSPAGETLVLSDAQANVIDRFETGKLDVGISAGRMEGIPTIARVFFTVPTKGTQNAVNSATSGYAAQPVLSKNELYCTEPFQLAISSTTDGAEIFYTLDGSAPSTGSHRYTEPITISKNTVLRTLAVAPGLLASDITSATYLFDEPHTIPVVSIVGDAGDIKTVWSVTQRNAKIEREVYLQYYERTGEKGTEFPAGIKAKGAGTLVYSQKSLTVLLRTAYGQGAVTYPFFGESEFKSFSALVLRNSGQDIGTARIRDSFFSRAVAGMHIDAAMTRPVALYINGAYYGLYDFNEDLNSDYLVTHYGVDGDAVDIIRRNKTVLSGDNADFLRVREFALSKNLADDAVFAEFAEWVDVAYFTDYFIAQTYFCNSDMFNQKYWRSQDYQVKWRPIYYDLDFGLSGYSRNMMASYFREDGVPSNDGSLTYMDIYIGLKKNKAWRDMCAERYVELICTQFSPARMTAILDEMAAEMEDEMPRQIKRWGQPSSMKSWRAAIATLRKNIEKRPEAALEHVRSFFGLSKAELDALVQKYEAA